MELLDFETRRKIKPGDIFKAHMAGGRGAPLGQGIAPNIDHILAGSAAIRHPPLGSATPSETGDFHGHEAFAARRGAPYHWGVSLGQRQPPSEHKTENEGTEQLEHMEKLQMGVIDAIHDALSKEALIKKLIIPFNNSFESKHAVSNWELQKNTALLELEQRNEQLLHQLRDAAKQVLEVQNMAAHDKRLLEDALQRGRDKLYLIGRAEAMRARLIEHKQIIARNQILYGTLSAWHRFCQVYRKKRTLKKSLVLWHRLVLMKWFVRFLRGHERIKHNQQLKVQVKCLCIQKSLRRCLGLWSQYVCWSKNEKKKVAVFVRSWAIYKLRVSYEGWRECSLSTGWKQIQHKRAANVWSFSYLRKALHGWNQHLVLATERSSLAKGFFFRRLAGDCFSEWRMFVSVKIKRSKQFALCIKHRDSSMHQIAFDMWKEKIGSLLVVRERLTHFVRRHEGRLQQSILMKWHQLVLRTRYLRIAGAMLTIKANIWAKRWAFSRMKQSWVRMIVAQRSQILYMHRTKLTFFRMWKAKLQSWKCAKWRVFQMQKNLEQRRQRMLFSIWMVYTAVNRKSAAAEESRKLAARVNVLETQLKGAERVKHQMEKLVLEFEIEKEKIKIFAEAAFARTPAWITGFLDVELRWTTPSLTWLPPARAGHSAVSLPSKRVVLFGGYNGEACFNDVLIFDTATMHWKVPAQSAAESCVIPQPMQTHTACAFGKNKMVVFGGYDGAQEFAQVHLLKISEDSLVCEWSQVQCMVGAKPGPVCQHTSCMNEDGSLMVVFGGYRSEVGLLNDIWVLDLQWLQWTCPEHRGLPPVPRRGHAGAVIGNKMYIFGGYNGREHLADLHALGMESMSWECIEGQGQVPSPRRQHAIGTVGRHLLIYGGYNGEQYLGDVFSFDTELRLWKQWPGREPSILPDEVGQGGPVYGRSMHTMVEAGQRLIVFGGVHEWGALQDIFFLENGAAIDGQHLQTCVLDEYQKTTALQAKVAEYEKALAQNATKLVIAQTSMEQLRNTLQVESEKRKKAVQGHRVLTKKLYKARKLGTGCKIST